MNANITNEEMPTSLPPYLNGWKSEKETLAEFRKLKPTLHKTTLNRMRKRKEILAIKFAGSWFYKPETAFQVNDASTPTILHLPPPDAA
jgi:hypothetical protein